MQRVQKWSGWVRFHTRGDNLSTEREGKNCLETPVHIKPIVLWTFTSQTRQLDKGSRLDQLGSYLLRGKEE